MPVGQLKKAPRASLRAWRRRDFLTGLGSATALTLAPGFLTGCASVTTARRSTRRKPIAIIATSVRKHSHAQHFIDRFLEGYGWQGQWYHPSTYLVSLYVDQFPEGDLAEERSKRFNVPIYKTIEEALTRGGSKLAVDGVLIIGEHGNYPKNEIGQTLYPRYKWFKQVVELFEKNGRSVPVFNDKHLSTSWREAYEMVEDSKRLKFPFMAGSSLPVTWRIPSIDIPLNTPMVESVCIGYGAVDSYDFHGLETAQCMSERRSGGEIGVRSVHAMRGTGMWDALEQQESTAKLFLAALTRSHTVRPPAGFTIARPSIAWARKASSDAVGYFIEHNDGFRTSVFLCNGLVQDFTYAGMKRGGEIISCQMHLPMPLQIATTADFFNPLVNHIEHMIMDNQVPYPVERTLLTTGMTAFAVRSLAEGGPIETPGMKVEYQPAAAPTYWRL